MHFLAALSLVPLVLAAPAPVIQPRAGQIIPGKYIVKLKAGASDATLKSVMSKLGSSSATNVYTSSGFKGFASKLDSATLATIQSLPEVSIKLTPEC
jgi:hypothetical protein